MFKVLLTQTLTLLYQTNMYYPKSQITPDLYTNGNEFQTSDGEYVGYYYLTSDGKRYTGRNPNDRPNTLLLPIGIVAVYFYNKQNCKKKCVHWDYAIIISLSFVLGTTVSYYSSSFDSKRLKLIFASLMIFLGGLMIFEEYHK